MSMRFFSGWVVVSGILVMVSQADGETTLQEWLARPVIGTQLPMDEVQKFTEEHIPRMPELSSVRAWERHKRRIRKQMFKRVIFRGEAAKWRRSKTRVVWTGVIDEDPTYSMKKLRYEVVPGLWAPAILYLPKSNTGQVPGVLNVNGHAKEGKALDYKQLRCINQVKRGMVALNVEWVGMGQLSSANYLHYRSNQLDLCGTSGLSVFYLAMERGLDILEDCDKVDRKRIAVTGLSGGGWQTIVISSLDKRVRLSDPVAGYSSFRTRARFLTDLGDSEQTPVDMATVADYTHLTALRAPRPTLLTFNDSDDCCFASDHALPPLLEAARPVFQLYGQPESLRFHRNTDPGTHNFEKDNRLALYRMFRDFFYEKGSFSAEEIAQKSDLKTKEELYVPLPDDNADFNTLAFRLMESLPRNKKLPRGRFSALRWQSRARRQLQQRVRLPELTVVSELVHQESKNGIEASFWKLKMGGHWTVPAVELAQKENTGTVILVGDGGKKTLVEKARSFLASGFRVLAVDPFYFGESSIAEKDFLFALLISSIGERPLGIQAGQLIGISNWIKKNHEGTPVTIATQGSRSSLFALIAAGLGGQSIDGLVLHGSMGSLKEIIENNGSVDKTPELFCFGLLEKFDIEQLVALAAPRSIEFIQPTARLVEELRSIEKWYSYFGADFSLKY